MKKLFTLLGILIIVGLAGQAQAITAHTYAEGIGYSQADFIIDTADPDSATKKIILFYGTSLTTVIRKDSLTSSISDPDTISKAVGTFNEGTTIYWYITVEDSTTTIRLPVDNSFFNFTTTDLQQNTTVSSISYETVNIIIDTTGVYPGVGLDSVRLDIDKTDGTTYSASITTVTVPQDTFAVTGLDENATYFIRTIAFLADSSAVDTLTAISFTTLDLAYTLTIIRANADSLIIKVDTTAGFDSAIDSLILQWSAGSRTLTQPTAGLIADTITSVTHPDTFIVVGLITAADYSFRVISYDGTIVDTTSLLSFGLPGHAWFDPIITDWGPNTRVYEWIFTKSRDQFSTGKIPIVGFDWMRSHLILLGEDDAATYDSVRVLRYTVDVEATTLLDTLLAGDVDTAAVTGDIFRLGFAGSDSLYDLYPLFTLGPFIEVIADMTDSSTAGFADSTLGTRTVYVILEFLNSVD